MSALSVGKDVQKRHRGIRCSHNCWRGATILTLTVNQCQQVTSFPNSCKARAFCCPSSLSPFLTRDAIRTQDNECNTSWKGRRFPSFLGSMMAKTTLSQIPRKRSKLSCSRKCWATASGGFPKAPQPQAPSTKCL